MAKVYKSRVIHAPVDKVWETIRDFNSLPQWHPAIKDSKIEEGKQGDQIGAVRSFHLTNGDHIREQLVMMCDREKNLAYTMLESPLPFTNYYASIKLYTNTDENATFAIWEASFNVPAEQEVEMTAMVGNDVFKAGLDALEEKLT